MKRGAVVIVFLLCGILFGAPKAVAQLENPKSGSVGIQGTISSPPPKTGATIVIPTNGQVFTKLPITVSGLCPGDLLVKVFKNNVFGGSVQCKNGSYSLIIDLFSGQNELVARVYDNLDQAGPDSNKVTVTFNDSRPGTGSRPTLTSIYAKMGVNPGQQLVWPIILSDGAGPYAVSIDWGDGTDLQLMSLGFPGPFDIKHVYKTPGVYNIIIKATDRNDASAYLQLVGIVNGPLSQEQQGGPEEDKAGTRTLILWQPAAIMLSLLPTTFWLGRKYELKYLKKKIERGERPF
ncbi:MAG TPA: hypothetical protein VK674_06425 [Candidatus Limnocylindria bacterium]|nr:hypothetical protein [Candidatus Limnocylindria bacterium]